MAKRRLILILFGCGLLIGALLLGLWWPREPAYAGRSLSDWVETYAKLRNMTVPTQTTALAEAAEAIQKIGTNAIPHLLVWIRADKGYYQRSALLGTVVRLPEWAWEMNRGTNLPLCICVPDAFGAIGSSAGSAVPELTHLANATNNDVTAYHSTLALGQLGNAGLAPLLDMLTNEQENIRHNAYIAIRSQGTNAAPAVPILVANYNRLGEPMAASTLGFLAVKPDLVVPALTNRLGDPRVPVRRAAIIALGRFGPQAKVATSALIKALQDRILEVRKQATNALRNINPAALTNALQTTNTAFP
jgi:hypothetical protein